MHGGANGGERLFAYFSFYHSLSLASLTSAADLSFLVILLFLLLQLGFFFLYISFLSPDNKIQNAVGHYAHKRPKLPAKLIKLRSGLDEMIVI